MAGKSPQSRVPRGRKQPPMDDLPPPNTGRWVARRKAAVVAAVRAGRITMAEVLRRYELTEEEFLSWQRAFESHGLPGLRQPASSNIVDRAGHGHPERSAEPESFPQTRYGALWARSAPSAAHGSPRWQPPFKRRLRSPCLGDLDRRNFQALHSRRCRTPRPPVNDLLAGERKRSAACSLHAEARGGQTPSLHTLD